MSHKSKCNFHRKSVQGWMSDVLLFMGKTTDSYQKEELQPLLMDFKERDRSSMRQGMLWATDFMPEEMKSRIRMAYDAMVETGKL